MSFFYLATLYASLRYFLAATPRGGTTAAMFATLCCFCGMACKEVMVSAPLTVLLFERTFFCRSLRQCLARSWPLYLRLALSWTLLAALNIHGPRSASAGFHLGIPVHLWWLEQARALFLYLKLVVCPWPLTIHYDMPDWASVAPSWAWGWAAAALIVAALVLLWRRSAAGFVSTWTLLMVGPTFVVPIVTEYAASGACICHWRRSRRGRWWPGINSAFV